MNGNFIFKTNAESGKRLFKYVDWSLAKIFLSGDEKIISALDNLNCNVKWFQKYLNDKTDIKIKRLTELEWVNHDVPSVRDSPDLAKKLELKELTVKPSPDHVTQMTGYITMLMRNILILQQSHEEEKLNAFIDDLNEAQAIMYKAAHVFVNVVLELYANSKSDDFMSTDSTIKNGLIHLITRDRRTQGMYRSAGLRYRHQLKAVSIMLQRTLIEALNHFSDEMKSFNVLEINVNPIIMAFMAYKFMNNELEHAKLLLELMLCDSSRAVDIIKILPIQLWTNNPDVNVVETWTELGVAKYTVNKSRQEVDDYTLFVTTNAITAESREMFKECVLIYDLRLTTSDDDEVLLLTMRKINSGHVPVTIPRISHAGKVSYTLTPHSDLYQSFMMIVKRLMSNALKQYRRNITGPTLAVCFCNEITGSSLEFYGGIMETISRNLSVVVQTIMADEEPLKRISDCLDTELKLMYPGILDTMDGENDAFDKIVLQHLPLLIEYWGDAVAAKMKLRD